MLTAMTIELFTAWVPSLPPSRHCCSRDQHS